MKSLQNTQLNVGPKIYVDKLMGLLDVEETAKDIDNREWEPL